MPQARPESAPQMLNPDMRVAVVMRAVEEKAGGSPQSVLQIENESWADWERVKDTVARMKKGIIASDNGTLFGGLKLGEKNRRECGGGEGSRAAAFAGFGDRCTGDTR